MKNYMRKSWNYKDPSLIISVTGGARAFDVPLKIKNIFKQGLYKVAACTDAWIITGGTDVGIMKLVGDSMKEAYYLYNKPFNVLGIATWGFVNRELIYKVILN